MAFKLFIGKLKNKNYLSSPQGCILNLKKLREYCETLKRSNTNESAIQNRPYITVYVILMVTEKIRHQLSTKSSALSLSYFWREGCCFFVTSLAENLVLITPSHRTDKSSQKPYYKFVIFHTWNRLRVIRNHGQNLRSHIVE